MYSFAYFKALKPSRAWEGYVMKLSIRLVIMLSCFGVCYVAPSFNNFIGFVGSFVLIFLGIILPPIAYLRAFREDLALWKKIGLWLMLLLNAGVWIAATCHSLKNIYLA